MHISNIDRIISFWLIFPPCYENMNFKYCWLLLLLWLVVILIKQGTRDNILWKATACFLMVFLNLSLNYLVPSNTEKKILGLKIVIHHNSCTLENTLVVEKTPIIFCSHALSFSRNTLIQYKLRMLLSHFIRIFL